MAFPATTKWALFISLSVGAILSGISRSNWKCELSLEAPGQGVFVTYEAQRASSGGPTLLTPKKARESEAFRASVAKPHGHCPPLLTRGMPR